MQDGSEEVKEDTAEYVDRHWDYYVKERAVPHALPLVLISTVAYAYLFAAAPLGTAALFGAVNCAVFTPLAEIARQHTDVDLTKASVILGVSYAVTTAFMNTVGKTYLSYQVAIPLALAAFGGQVARICFMDEA